MGLRPVLTHRSPEHRLPRSQLIPIAALFGRRALHFSTGVHRAGPLGSQFPRSTLLPLFGGATGSAFFHGRADKRLQPIRQLRKLPNLLVMARSTSGCYGLRAVDQHTQAVICSVGRRHRMANSPRDRDGHLVRTLTCSGMGGDSCTLGDASPDLPSGPRTAYRYGLSRTDITAMTLE
jgi:hypothetical protein